MISYICRNISKNLIKSNLKLQIRKGHGQWTYRAPQPPPERKNVILAEIIGGLAWWWVLWHLWHEWGHIVGEFPYPEPSKWTDEELGILPEDEN
ncbi:NADH dehydrogenase [ubiquinone] 1 beta subcomplex subunit 2, mitochondrial-like [Centruroides vittatus]|uniref:NADH dehydrogenase [ubiquinone] 1 beta subcomplex subunit 2, mitochondrial-like n=1 Tax=Centruroides vittatus TaxID=120091 RepID=UPI0035100486